MIPGSYYTGASLVCLVNWDLVHTARCQLSVVTSDDLRTVQSGLVYVLLFINLSRPEILRGG
jgi:hypothetical protein